MNRLPFLVFLPLITFSLIACTSVAKRQEDALKLLKDVKLTASGALDQAADLLQKGKTITEDIGDAVEDTKRRVNQVGEGVDLLLKGTEKIEKGLGG